MQERHSDREKYFKEQVLVTEKYVIPYIRESIQLNPGMTVAEVGCGEAGNLKPFVDMGCKVYGIDIAAHKIENARRFYENHPLKQNIHLVAADIYKVRPEDVDPLDLIIMRDAIEHIPNQELFLGNLKKFLKPDGKIFFAFPPWRMPFGGHHQVCASKVLSNLPYLHLLPESLYVGMLKLFGESDDRVNGLLEIRETRISIHRFHNILVKNRFSVVRQDYYLINPNYEIKFGFKVRKLPSILNIPHLKDFFTTTCYCIVGLDN
ncbi:MAG TPA: class I SAM-dependent methyltransferase [Paludibacter sp.]|nr:class I SAM-dependent methyltransferase [Paludibacter sp.]